MPVRRLGADEAISLPDVIGEEVADGGGEDRRLFVQVRCAMNPPATRAVSLQCHCRDCQRASGTAYVAAMRVPAAGFRVTQGTPKQYVSKSEAGNAVTRAFCGDCGSPLYIQVSTRPDIVGIRVGTLDDPSGSSVLRSRHLCQKRPALGPHEPGPALPKYPTYPPGKAY